ncbi:MAG TPA: M3 family metallopeptidase [Chitinophagaceae bacterium]|nr:M3 family metallopeptidase [Chitinophagaceae bacterium]
MKLLWLLLLVVTSASGQTSLHSLPNPLLDHSNSSIRFDTLTIGTVDEAISKFYEEKERLIQQVVSIPAGKQTFQNTALVFDKIKSETLELMCRMELESIFALSDTVRNKSKDELGKLYGYFLNLLSDENLYRSIKRFYTSGQGRNLVPDQKKILNDALLALKIKGMELAPAERKELEQLNEKIGSLGTQFADNIAFKKAYPANEKILDSMLYYRQQVANVLGYRSYASFALQDKMAASPENVWNFLTDLKIKITPSVGSYIAELKAIKKQMHPDSSDVLSESDFSFYRKKLLEKKYNYNANELKNYFELDNTVRGMFRVCEKLFGLKIKQVHGPVWNEKVTSYELYADGKKRGMIYLDLYPRPGKYGTENMTPITWYRKENGKEILPAGVLKCNLAEPDSSGVSLLSIADVTTLFHEFGHLLHFLLLHTELSSQFFDLKADFVEAPSQFLENWVYEYDALKLFARHYKTGEILPKSLCDKLKKAHEDGNGPRNMMEIYFSFIDLTFYDKYDSIKSKTLDEVTKQLYVDLQVPFQLIDHVELNFHHLAENASYYYNYLWSNVYAKDLFSVFQKNGVMDTKTGIRYRKEILEKAGTVDEMQAIKKFLGREANSDAYMRSLGIK